MKFEIINPNDKAFVEGDDFETICLSITPFYQKRHSVDVGHQFKVYLSEKWRNF